ncbi:hypothetical protein [Paludibacterium denitrificans]|uniref:Uncharacterized protein n=1 Tax=Paludibacterium denitrificans TaxID=2675226 RepID=A0A844GBE8_9NEIS|nr:hypothetical protein [Paludibacterium denitrificans]MTD33092.1 hypothetical protein [Paludibacterium denitrificans]
MKKIIILIATFVLIIAAWNGRPIEKLATIEILHGRHVILFKKNCEYSAISLDNQNGESISELVFSEYPDSGPVFKENTYIDISKAMKYPLQRGHEYGLRLSTDCLGNNQIPVYRIKFHT